MANNYDKPGTGTAWKNDKYEKGGTQPYAKGSVIAPDGTRYDLALWIPKSEKVKGFNVTLKEPYKKDEYKQPAPPSVNEDGSEEDLPF